jgi:hypothetical protein
VIAQIKERFMFYVYGLHLAGDDEIRYVGSTCNPKSRLTQHLGDKDSKNPDKEKWIADNRRNVRMMILQSDVPEKNRRKAEEKAIREYRSKGHRLFNARRAAMLSATAQDVAWWLDRIEGDKPF